MARTVARNCTTASSRACGVMPMVLALMVTPAARSSLRWVFSHAWAPPLPAWAGVVADAGAVGVGVPAPAVVLSASAPTTAPLRTTGARNFLIIGDLRCEVLLASATADDPACHR